MMQTIQSDSSFSSFSDHFCLGKCRVYSFKSAYTVILYMYVVYTTLRTQGSPCY